MPLLIAALIFQIVVRSLLAVRWFVMLHVRYPLHFLTAYSALIVWNWLVDGKWFAALLLLGSAGFIVWKFWGKWKESKRNRAFGKVLADAMEASIWKELPKHKFVRFSFVSPDVIRVRFTTPSGHTDEDVIKTFPRFKAALRLVDAIVVPDSDPFDGCVTVMFCRTSPLDTVLDASMAPVLHSPEVVEDPFFWLPVGMDARGEMMELPLFLKDGGSVRQMCAGASGSGKSSIARQQLLQAVLCRHIDVMVLDGKGSEFVPYEPYVQMYGKTASDFWAQLRFLENECQRRAAVLRENTLSGQDRFAPSWNHHDDGNFLFWLWDELGAIMAGFENSQRFEAMSRLYGVLSIARSLGIAVVFSSQTFKADILTTQIRDNCFDTAIGFKMNSTQEAAYIGFDGDDSIRPDLIKDVMSKSGSYKKAGTFAFRGIGEPTYGRSYYLPAPLIKKALKRAPVVAATADDSTPEREKEAA